MALKLVVEMAVEMAVELAGTTEGQLVLATAELWENHWDNSMASCKVAPSDAVSVEMMATWKVD